MRCVAYALSVISFGRSHLQIYPFPMNINYNWNFGFLLFIAIFLQIISGLIITLYFTNTNGYVSLLYLVNEVYYGYCLRYFHSNGASIVNIFLLLHLGRSLYYNTYRCNSMTWNTGIIIFLLVIVISFLGYVLAWGQISFWGATVITNILSPIPYLITWLNGNYYITTSTLQRFFIFHFIIPFIVLIVLVLHIFYLHYMCSNNSLGLSNNASNTIHFSKYALIKDNLGALILYMAGLAQVYYGYLLLSHPDNLIEVNMLMTPAHIVPEWYFLAYYTILKVIPHKVGGLLVIIYTLTSLTILQEFNRLYISNNYNTTFFTMSILGYYVLLMYIGAQLPQDTNIFLGRLAIVLLLSLTVTTHR